MRSKFSQLVTIVTYCHMWSQLSQIVTCGHNCRILSLVVTCGHNCHILSQMVTIVTCGHNNHMWSQLSHVVTIVICILIAAIQISISPPSSSSPRGHVDLYTAPSSPTVYHNPLLPVGNWDTWRIEEWGTPNVAYTLIDNSLVIGIHGEWGTPNATWKLGETGKPKFKMLFITLDCYH